jgi:hypothetical protein
MVDIAPCLADPELVFDVLPVDLLEALPVDLLHRLFTLLLLPDNKDEAVSRSHSSAPLHSSMAGHLAACSQHLRAAYLTLPEHAFRAPALALLGLSQTVSPMESIQEPNWRHAYHTTCIVWRRLARMPPFTEPKEGQKYLRWLVGELEATHSADAPVVRRALVGLSLLPRSIATCFRASDGRWEPPVRAAVQYLFAAYRAIAAPKERVDEAATRLFDFGRFERVCEGMLEGLGEGGSSVSLRRSQNVTLVCEGMLHDLASVGEDSDAPRVEGCACHPSVHPSQKLRLLMAEYEQIRCRGAAEFIDAPMPRSLRRGAIDLEALEAAAMDHSWRSTHRQLGSFCQLVRLANHDKEVEFWA